MCSLVLNACATAQPSWCRSSRGRVRCPERTARGWPSFADHVIGTIGGGHLEWSAIDSAQAQLPTANEPWRSEVALGPSLGQCCGGRVRLRFEPISAQDRDRLGARLSPTLHAVALFGGGHVGHAIVQALAPLPFAVHWVDSRDGVFPDHLPAQTRTEHSEPVHLAVRDIAPHSRVLIMSFFARRRPGHRGGLLAAPTRAPRPALCRPDREPNQMGDVRASLARTRIWRGRTATHHLPDRLAGHHGQSAGGDRGQRGGTNAVTTVYNLNPGRSGAKDHPSFVRDP